MVKQCSKCKVYKDQQQYRKDKGKKDGLHSYCKDCHSKQAKEWRAKNRNKYLQNAKEYTEKYRSCPNKRRRNRAHGHCRQAYSRGATPCGCCSKEDLVQFYVDTPEGMTVDHIEPCAKGGKHCLNNMRYLSPSENFAQGAAIRESIRQSE